MQTGATALHLACIQGHVEVVHLLIQAHANINKQDKVRIVTLVTCHDGQ